MEDTEGMYANYADKGDDCRPNSCVQGEYPISCNRPDFKTQAFVPELDNIGHKKGNSQKDHNGHAVDEDHGQKSILE